VNTIYDNARYRMLSAALNWAAEPMVLSAWGGTPDFNPVDKTIAQVKARGNIEFAWSMPITSQTVSTDGTAQTNDILIPGVVIGQTVTWFTMSDQFALHDASELILFIDEAFELPFIGNDLDMLIRPDWLSNRGWFRP
jgi:hypothetical protein